MTTLISLPQELHLQIRSYLSPKNCTLVGLACRRLHSIYFPTPPKPAEEYSLWEMVDRRWLGRENPVWKRWLLRIKVSRYVDDWVNRVTYEAWQRSGLPGDFTIRHYPPFFFMKFCVGCARFKRKSEEWKNGIECLSKIEGMQRWEDFGSYSTRAFLDRWCFWDDLEYALADGDFCSACGPHWRGLESAYMSNYWSQYRHTVRHVPISVAPRTGALAFLN